MRTLLFASIILVFFISACRKSRQPESPMKGVWVESSLRLDTLDFDAMNRIDRSPDSKPMVYFRSNIYTDTVLNPVSPVNHSTLYEYYFNDGGDSLSLYSLLSSSYQFLSYRFIMSPGGRSFTIGKFYLRRSLPPVLEFVRIR